MKSSAEADNPLGRAQWRGRWRRSIFAAAFVLTFWNRSALQAQPPQSISLEKAQRVLWISRQAAQNHMQDLSLRSTREALGNGSPNAPLTNTNGEDLDLETAQRLTVNAVEVHLSLLSDLWQQQQFDTTAVWETLLEVTLPQRRPEEIFIYQRMESHDSLALDLTDHSAGYKLIRQTLEVGRVGELRSLLESRLSHPQSELDAWILLLQLALEENNVTETRLRLQQCSQQMLEAAETQQQLPVAITLLRAWTIPELRDALPPVIERWIAKTIESPPDSKTDQCAIILSKILTREFLRTGDTEAALRTLGQADVLINRMAGNSYSPVIEHHLAATKLLLQYGLERQAMKRFLDIQALEMQQGSRNPQTTSQAAILTRYFQQLPAKDRYELLRQQLFVQNPSALLSPAIESGSVEFPPDAFFEIFPEPIRQNGFSKPAVAASNSIVSSVTELIIAAREAGESEALKAELLKLRAENHRASAYLLALFYLHNDLFTEATDALRAFRDNLKRDAQNHALFRDIAFDFLAAKEAAEKPQTRIIAIDMLDIIQQLNVSNTDRHISALASECRALALAASSGKNPRQLLEIASPELWLSAVNSTGSTREPLNQRPIWIAHDGIISHQAGTENDSLYFPWPLGGTFEFSVSSLSDMQLDGSPGFDGLTCEVVSPGTVTVSGLGIDNPHRLSRQLCQSGTYVRKSVRVTPTQLTFLINGHPVFTEERAAHSSPWLALFALGSQVSMFRFPEFSGSPEILPEVSLSNDPQMRGWSCAFFGQSRSSTGADRQTGGDNTSSSAEKRKSFDWTWKDGIITGQQKRDARRLDGMMDQNLQGLLRYDRPLQSDETLNWEFDYSPGRVAVHPALDRLAFLIQPDGIHLHWMSIGTDEWNLLPADNQILVRSEQRGPAELDLREGWNQATLSLQEDTAFLSINGVVACEHKLRSDNSRQFGLFHFRDRTTARARNIVLTGEWPNSLTTQHLSMMTGSRESNLASMERHALHRMIGERTFSTDVVDMIQSARALTPDQRYEFLREWVLPGDGHADWQMLGDLEPSDPAPSRAAAAGSHPLESAMAKENMARQSSGGFVISPALELVRAANETGQLSSLQSLVESMPESAPSDQRAKLALLILVALQDDRPADAIPLIQQMTRTTKSMIHFRESQVWPELIVAQQTLKTPEMRPHAIEMLRHVDSIQHLGGQSGDPATERCLESMISLGELLERAKIDKPVFGPLRNWQPFRITRADYRNDGLPQPLWIEHEDESIQHVSGFQDDILCYPTPLTGDFEFECELTPAGGDHLLVGYGGFFLEPAAEKDKFNRIPFGRKSSVLRNAILVADQNSVWKYRLVVSKGQATVFVNDEQVATEPLTASSPPWLCIRAASKPGAGIRNIQLNGTFTIPESIELNTGRDLDGWCRPYFGGNETFAPRTGSASDWKSDESVIVGPLRTVLVGTKSESLLQYFRPMLEDGTITYSFYHEPGAALAHPTLDRLAFLLDRDQGVLIHEITNGTWERSGLNPANAQAEAPHQLVKTLPLLEKDWNKMKVQLNGDTVTLILNGTEIFSRPLEQTNHRTFGLFHFRDETTARVRRISWQGQWHRPEK